MIKEYAHIDHTQWLALVETSETASWFQTPEAYKFYLSVGNELDPFCYAVETDGQLKGLICGYVVAAKWLFRYFTSRAIILGGPLLDSSISNNELSTLLNYTREQLQEKAIYVEMRNFNDYSNYKLIFEQCGFEYVPHYNYLQPTATIDNDMDRNRKRSIKQAINQGIEIIADINQNELSEFYSLLHAFYRKQLRLPLFSFVFFEQLMHQPNAHIFLAKHNGRIVGGEVCVELKGKTLYNWYGCGGADSQHLHPSEYATYKAIAWARDNGISTFDFMGAGSPEQKYGVREFKARFGGTLVEYGRFLHINAPIRYRLGAWGIKLMERPKTSGCR